VNLSAMIDGEQDSFVQGVRKRQREGEPTVFEYECNFVFFGLRNEFSDCVNVNIGAQTIGMHFHCHTPCLKEEAHQSTTNGKPHHTSPVVFSRFNDGGHWGS